MITPMKSPFWLCFTALFFNISIGFSQEFVNGSFEANDGVETINMTLADFNVSVSNCVGSEDLLAPGVPNIDLMTTYGSPTYAPPYDGDWFLGIHQVDIVALELTAPLIMGNTYTISFWNKYAFFATTTNIELGATEDGTDFGIPIGLVYEYVFGEWTNVVYEFVAPNNATHITVSLDELGPDDWVGIDHFEFLCNPLIIDAPVTELCEGDEITLTATSETGGVIDWDGGVTNGLPFTPPVGPTTYTATSSSDLDCDASVEISVYPLPDIDAGLDESICLGDEVTLVGTGAGPGGIYDWDGGVLDDVAFTPAATTTYTLTGTDNKGCINTDEVTITVNPLPVIDAGPDETICSGELVTLSGSGAGIGGLYVWDVGVLDSEPFDPDATTTYTVIGTDINGCEGTDDVTITVNPLPAVDAGPDHLICDGDETTLTASGAGLGGFYVWDGGIVDGVSFTPDVTTTYTVYGTDDNGCTNVDDVTVTVSPLPAVSAGDDQIICIGDALTLFGTGAGLGGTYTWDGGVDNGISFTPVANSTYTVIGVDAFGCVNTDEMSLTVNPLPIVLIGADNLGDCPPFNVNFSSLTPGTSFDWEFGDGSLGSGASPSHDYINTGEYDITLTVVSADGCVNSETFPNYIEAYPVPQARFTYFPNSIQISDPNVEFTNHSIDADSYEWNFGDGSPLSHEVDPMHLYPAIGDIQYTVELNAMNSYGCVDSTDKTLLINEEILYFIPNSFTPDGDQFNETFKPIFVAGLDVYDYHFIIFNRWGEMVFESYDVEYGWDGTYGSKGLVIDGTYVWRIDFGETRSDGRHAINGHVNLIK